MTPPAPCPRRTVLALLPLLAVTALPGCGSSPPVLLYQLRIEAPVALPPRAPSAQVWQLLQPVRVPDYLDRESLLLPQGQNGLLALSGQRWAESLRDAVPRVLRADLALLLGESRIWTSPVPAGVVVTRQLRVELLALDAEAQGAAVRLHARWTVIDPSGQLAARTEAVRLRAASPSASIDGLVAAHRLALWQLAERIAASP